MSQVGEEILTSAVEMESDGSQDHVVNIRWYLEGILLLIIGALGVIGE